MLDRISPIESAEAVDLTSTDYAPTKITNAIYIGGAGDLKVDMALTGTVIFKALPIGLYYFKVKTIYKTGTAATSILACF